VKEMKIVTFGELMMRLCPSMHQRLIQTGNLEVSFGGAEANVAVGLSQLGDDAYFVTVLPEDERGDAAENELRRYGVKTDYVFRSEHRMGLYFLEAGYSQRPSKVIYDRAGSAFSSLSSTMFDWREIMSGASWFHVSGITPALGDHVADAVMEAVRHARREGMTVSLDLNYRKKLWSREKAGEVLSGLLEHVDVLVSNEEDIESVFGIKAEGADIETGKLAADDYRQVAESMMRKFPSLGLVAITLRESLSASDNVWSAVAWDGKQFHRSRKYDIHVLDRVGGGDAFSAGLIYGLVREQPVEEALEFAVAASCLKHAVRGDFPLIRPDEVHALLATGGSGRIQR